MIPLILTLLLQVTPADTALRLQDLEAIALDKNPALVQAAANIRAAEGRTKQAGLLPESDCRCGKRGPQLWPGYPRW